MEVIKKRHSSFKDRTGEKYINNQGHKMEIIAYFGEANCTVLFENGVIVHNKQYSNFKRGMIDNPYHRGIYGIGYMGEGIYNKRENNNMSKCYNVWQSMLTRCCSEDYKNKKPSYKDVIVCKEWECFQNFAEWFYKKHNPESMEDWHLDKDILFKGNKVYSPETCCFVPQEINGLLISTKAKRGELPIGVTKSGKKFRARFGKGRDHLGLYYTKQEAFDTFKRVKEEYIKKVADEWKDRIEPEVYQAMYNWIIEITD